MRYFACFHKRPFFLTDSCHVLRCWLFTWMSWISHVFNLSLYFLAPNINRTQSLNKFILSSQHLIMKRLKDENPVCDVKLTFDRSIIVSELFILLRPIRRQVWNISHLRDKIFSMLNYGIKTLRDIEIGGNLIFCDLFISMPYFLPF